MADLVPDYLPRGRACVICRRKKTKCDGVRPVCGGCVRAGCVDHCLYTSETSPSNLRVLQERERTLEAEIRRREGLRSEVVLHPPCELPGQNWWDTPEPPSNIRRDLIRCLLPHASQIDFYLNAQGLDADMASTAPTLPPALRFAVYLWGLRLMRDPAYTRHEATFLRRTLRHEDVALASIQQQASFIVPVLQTEVLIANYFFSSGRLTEGQLRTSAALSLALSCGLHRVGGQNTWLPSAISPADVKDRINTWWHIFFLEKSWNALVDTPSTFMERQESGTIIETPWPESTEILPGDPQQRWTIQNFLANVTSDVANSPLVLRCKAAALLAHASEVASHQDGFQAIGRVDLSIEQFKETLPPMLQQPPLHPNIAHELLVIQSLAQAATICLHKAFTTINRTSLIKCVSASFDIIRLIGEANLGTMNYVDSILAMVWANVCEILVFVLRMTGSPSYDTPSFSALPRREMIQAALNQLDDALSHCVDYAPLFGSQRQKMREVLGLI